MSKTTLAAVTFALGLLIGSLSVVHSQQSQPAPAQPQSKNQPYVIGVFVAGAEPTVPALPKAMMDVTIDRKVNMQPLDGLNCKGCVINADVISYAGGAYNCDQCVLKADRVELRGAARNTFVFLHQVTALLPQQEQPNPNRPTVNVAADKKGATLTLASAVQ